MHNSKLIQELKQLDPAEFKELGKFLESPFLNSNKGLVRFFEFLKKHYPRFEEKNVAKEEVFKAIYPPGKAFNDNELRALRSDFSKAVETFLSFWELKRDKWQQQKMYVSALGRKGDYLKFQEAIEALIQQLNARKERNMVYFYELFDLNRRLFFHPQTKKLQADVPSLEQAMTNLDHFFVLSKLRLAAEMKGRQKNLKEKHKVEFLEEVRHFAAAQNEQNSATRMYLGILHLLDEHQDEIYQQLNDDFIKPSDTLTKEELAEILPFLLNHGNGQSALGKKEFRRKIFDLYKVGLEKDLLSENGKMDPIIFMNIARLGVTFKEFDWTEWFIKSYESYLEPGEREEITAVSRASTLFFQGNFKDALHLLNQYSFKYQPLMTTSKRMGIQCAYELMLNDSSYLNLLHSNITTFDRYLYRNKHISPKSIEMERQFCKITGHLADAFLQMSIGEKREIVNSIKNILQEEKDISGRTWLLEKANAILQKPGVKPSHDTWQ